MKKLILALSAITSMIIAEKSFSQGTSFNTTGANPAATNFVEILQPSTTNNTVGLFVSHTGAATNAYGIWAQATGATNKYAIVVPAGAGNVGIGTTTPASLFHVNGAGRFGTASSANGSLIFNNSTNANAVTLQTGVTSTSYTVTLPTAQGAASTFLQNNGSGVLSWVAGGAANNWTNTGTGSAIDANTIFPGVQIRNNTQSFYTANLTMTYNGAASTGGEILGSVCYGDNQGTAAQAGIFSNRDAASGGAADLPTRLVFYTTADGSGTMTEAMRIDNTGNVGIGTTNPGYPLEVASTNAPVQTFNAGKYGTTASATAWTSAGTTSLVNPAISIKAAGYIWSATGILASSDRRAKENIVSRNSVEALVLINKLNPVQYNWIDRSKSVNAFEEGFIAQEVEQVLPQVINTNVETIPSIMEMVEKTTYANNQIVFTLKKSDKVKAGVVLKVILEDGKEYKWPVVSVNRNEVILNTEESIVPSGKIFVYGEVVYDFKTVDYDKVFTVGISAIQELSRLSSIQSKKIKILETMIDSQRKQNEGQIQSLKEEMNKMKILIASQASK